MEPLALFRGAACRADCNAISDGNPRRLFCRLKQGASMFGFKTLKWAVQAPPNDPGDKCIGLITLNRPEALNAIDVRMRVELDLLLDQIRRDDRIRVVIITGEGRGFSAGGDLRTEAGPLGALDDDHDFGAFGAYKELANYFFNDLR